ncbi:muscular LMNA-interacting protein isoform X2 [Heterocephalus glaber]|uniref:Muscular LMNA-interacting protein isoform X2 n=1 Tax=Heterocephalus glaber TaxID=10181 RepID=A0AAX6S2U3_HETGA|nr:muscular LMNA-interacting protein isoform X2 [Heterocephalus glaber]
MEFEKHEKGSLLSKNLEDRLTSKSIDYMTFNLGSEQGKIQGSPLTCLSEDCEKNSQGERFKANDLQGMQQGDLFKAEYVFIVDSEGEDEVTSRKGDQGAPGGTGKPVARPTSLVISSSLVSDVVRPKVWGPELKAASHTAIPQEMVSQQKQEQLTSPTTPAQLASKSPPFSFVSPTNQRARPVPANLEELRTRRLDTAGPAPCPAPEGGSRLSGPHAARPGEAAQKPGPASEAQKQTPPGASRALGPQEGPGAPRSPASEGRGRDAASYIPVRIVTHALSPSPKPLAAPFRGASPVCSQRSSSQSLSRSGLKSPVPSRLSLLTAILKSNPSHQRPVSPASCPTFSLNSLASSTSTLDQKAKQTSPTPRKSLSSCSLRAGSPEQEGPRAPALGLARPAPLSQVPPRSPATLASSSPASLSVEKPPSPTLRIGAPCSQPHSGASGAATLPPGPAGSCPLSASKGKQDADFRLGEKPRNIYTHPSALASAPLSSPIHQSATLSSPEKYFYPSPALSHLIERSRKASSQLSSQRPSRSAPSPLPRSSSSSNGSAASFPSLESSLLSSADPPSRTLPHSPAALSPRCGRNTLPARMGKPESTKPSCRSPVSAPTPPISLTRTKDLVSPFALSLATSPENKKPKQYKTKSSYKVFAAIPTNTLLLEQKALDEPAQAESVSQDSSVDLPLELCFPAQLRQQTEELCAAIDKVLQDSLSMHSSDSPSRSPQQTLLGSETIKSPTTLPRAAGRETKYANLSLSSSTASESQLTKPGVIRPVPIKSRILLKKEEEVYEPNPFSKYLDDNSGLFSEQLSHPMVAIPEHETLDSKEQ